MKNTNIKILLLIAGILTLQLSFASKPDEGMFPLSDLKKINLEKAGFGITQEDIFNPNGISLTNALVRIGGCTGSFISDEGLIITNHHCVFGAVSGVSTVEKNYLETGFMAKNKSEEIPVNIPCKITRSYDDVSSIILDGVEALKDGTERQLKIKENTKALIEKESKLHPDLTIEVSEMFLGRSYVLFRYEVLKDTRLVYVPPRQIGKFGGDTDNWEWPRHTGDFSIVRAYSNKDNKTADYSTENIPYIPQKHLTINPEGVQEDDLVFILGYPGRTFRHQPAPYIEYQQKHLLPFISEWFALKIDIMMQHSRNIGDEARYLEFASSIERLANVRKNYEGKLQGLARTNLLNQKIRDDHRIRLKASQQPNIEELFKALDDIENLYKSRDLVAQKHLILSFLQQDAPYFRTALQIVKMQQEAENLPKNQRKAYWESKKTTLKSLTTQSMSPKNQDIELLFFEHLMAKLATENAAPESYLKAKNKKNWVASLYKKYTKDKNNWSKWAENNPVKFSKAKSSMTLFAASLLPDILEAEKQANELNAALNVLLPIYTELKSQTFPDNFIPDANSTMRLTYGYIRRYSPNDGEVHYPLTSVQGIIEKYKTGKEDYFLPDNLSVFFQRTTFPEMLLDKKNKKPVVCMLYNLDTTGGNSGSPVMDKNGNLVGVNFDRSYTATINDYAWNEEYSRSIAVDIRFVVYVMKYLSGADHLLKEMNVELQ
jgi:hypothetical protein